jgi:hypothetical protein
VGDESRTGPAGEEAVLDHPEDGTDALLQPRRIVGLKMARERCASDLTPSIKKPFPQVA